MIWWQHYNRLIFIKRYILPPMCSYTHTISNAFRCTQKSLRTISHAHRPIGSTKIRLWVQGCHQRSRGKRTRFFHVFIDYFFGWPTLSLSIKYNARFYEFSSWFGGRYFCQLSLVIAATPYSTWSLIDGHIMLNASAQFWPDVLWLTSEQRQQLPLPFNVDVDIMIFDFRFCVICCCIIVIFVDYFYR